MSKVIKTRYFVYLELANRKRDRKVLVPKVGVPLESQVRPTTSRSVVWYKVVRHKVKASPYFVHFLFTVNNNDNISQKDL